MDSTPVEETNIPRQAIYRGRKVRVLEYLGRNRFVILDPSDNRRHVWRVELTFPKAKSS